MILSVVGIIIIVLILTVKQNIMLKVTSTRN